MSRIRNTDGTGTPYGRLCLTMEYLFVCRRRECISPTRERSGHRRRDAAGGESEHHRRDRDVRTARHLPEKRRRERDQAADRREHSRESQPTNQRRESLPTTTNHVAGISALSAAAPRVSLVPYDDDEDENVDDHRASSSRPRSPSPYDHNNSGGSSRHVADWRPPREDAAPPLDDARPSGSGSGYRRSNQMPATRSGAERGDNAKQAAGGRPSPRSSSKPSPRRSSLLSPRGNTMKSPRGTKKSTLPPRLAANDHYRRHRSQTSPRSSGGSRSRISDGGGGGIESKLQRSPRSRSRRHVVAGEGSSTSNISAAAARTTGNEEVKVKTEPDPDPDGESGGSRDYSKLTPEQIIAMEKQIWIRSAPADLYYERDPVNPAVMRATARSKGYQVGNLPVIFSNVGVPVPLPTL
jgi:hypothetical protein